MMSVKNGLTKPHKYVSRQTFQEHVPDIYLPKNKTHMSRILDSEVKRILIMMLNRTIDHCAWYNQSPTLFHRFNSFLILT